MNSGPGRIAADLAPPPRRKAGELQDPAQRANLPLCFVTYITRMQERARELGYCIAVHGSLRRDCDVVAIPWTDDAVPARALVSAMIEATGGFLDPQELGEYFEAGCPGAKPHGRLVWTIHLGGGPYIDLSVMPCLPEHERGWRIGEPLPQWVPA